MDKVALAEKLANELRELADACVPAANGDKAARAKLEANMDKYWFALVVGRRGDVQNIISDEEE